MRRLIYLPLLLLLILATLLGDDGAGVESLPSLELTVRLRDPDAPTPYWGSPLPLVVSLENVSDEPRTVPEGNPWHLCSFDVETVPPSETDERDERNGIVPQGAMTRYALHQVEQARQSERTDVTLQPNENIEFEIDLTRCFNLSEGGQYQITVSRMIGNLGGESQFVESDPFEFRLVPLHESSISIEFAYPAELLPDE